MAITQQHSQNKLAGKRITEAELAALPKDGNKYELVNGRVQTVPTHFLHESIVMNLIALLVATDWRRYGTIVPSNLGCRLSNGNVRSPDVGFITAARLPTGDERAGFFDGAPNLCIEVISPSENRGDMSAKVVEYLESGAEQVWQVFSEAQRVVVYRSLDQVRTYEAHEELTAGELIPGFSCSVADIFAV